MLVRRAGNCKLRIFVAAKPLRGGWQKGELLVILGMCAHREVGPLLLGVLHQHGVPCLVLRCNTLGCGALLSCWSLPATQPWLTPSFASTAAAMYVRVWPWSVLGLCLPPSKMSRHCDMPGCRYG
jgi:hypothetical protein